MEEIDIYEPVHVYIHVDRLIDKHREVCKLSLLQLIYWGNLNEWLFLLWFSLELL